MRVIKGGNNYPMNRYKIKLSKVYIFSLDGENKNSINDKIDYLLKKTKILDMPCIKYNVKIKVKRIADKNKLIKSYMNVIARKKSKKQSNV